MHASASLFAEHAVNKQRVGQGHRPATNIWLWGQGKSPQLPAFETRFGLRGAMITAVDLLRGLAALIGWDRLEVEAHGLSGHQLRRQRAGGRHGTGPLRHRVRACRSYRRGIARGSL